MISAQCRVQEVSGSKNSVQQSRAVRIGKLLVSGCAHKTPNIRIQLHSSADEEKWGWGRGEGLLFGTKITIGAKIITHTTFIVEASISQLHTSVTQL